MKALVEMENSGLVVMLTEDKFADMQRMYNLFKRVEGGHALIRDTLHTHVKEVRLAYIHQFHTCLPLHSQQLIGVITTQISSQLGERNATP
jgi:hypothetical protein